MSRLVWFRNDLRLDDNESLRAATKDQPKSLLYVFIYDSRWDELIPEGVPRLGPYRRRFLTESVKTLSDELNAAGGDLLCLYGLPEEIVPRLCAQFEVTEVYASSAFAHEEWTLDQNLKATLAKQSIDFVRFVNQTLHHPLHLPFPIEKLPLVFTEFRKAVEASLVPRTAHPAPARVPPSMVLSRIESSELRHWCDHENLQTNQLPIRWSGGEREAQKRLREYVWDKDRLRIYKETRSGLLNEDDSTKLSPWLACGALSSRRVAAEVAKYEQQRLKNDSTYWLIFELLWRDYFQYLALKSGARFFARSGLKPRGEIKFEAHNEAKEQLFQAWCNGMTGFPLVDAAMRELKNSGWMPNQARQNAASFLVHDLGVDWRKGARWFESYLLDYEPCSNWGNWAYAAGVGTDPRNRQFNVVKQSLTYDPDGNYIRRWIPELTGMAGQLALRPWEESLFAATTGYPSRICSNSSKPGYN